MRLAAAVERGSEHPLADAVVAASLGPRGLEIPAASAVPLRHRAAAWKVSVEGRSVAVRRVRGPPPADLQQAADGDAQQMGKR